jgi:hypothetical protein
MDCYGYLFSDENFSSRQILLFEVSVRNPLEKGKKEGSQAIAVNA